MATEINTLNTSKKILPFILIGGLILVSLIGFLLTISQKNNPNNQVNPSLLPAYPRAQTQIFVNNGSQQTGALVVTSSQGGVKTTIDELEVQDPNFFPFTNTPPFVVPKIPVGNHVLRSSKPGFLTGQLNIEIKPSQVSTIDIILQTDNNQFNLKSAEAKMPITTKEYVIEYLDSIGLVRVSVIQSPYETSKQKAVDWFKSQGVSDPTSEGVLFLDLTKTNVH